MTRLRPAAALAGFALLAQLSSGCCVQRPLFGRMNYCGPVLNRPLFVPSAHATPAAAPVELGGYPVGAGAPGCVGCGVGAPIGMAAPGGYPHDAYAHGSVGAPPNQFALGGVPPAFTGYPTTVLTQPLPLGGPTAGPNVSRELPPPQVMPTLPKP